MINGQHPQPGSPGDQVDWGTYLSEKQVRAELDINAAQLGAFLRKGLISKERLPATGELKFSPLSVERLRVHLESTTVEQLHNTQEVNSELKDVLGKACKLLDQAHEHIEKLSALLTGPMGKGIEFMEQIVDAQNQRIDSLQQHVDSALSLREEWLSRAHERDLKTQEFQARQVHINTAIEGMSAALGPVLQPLVVHLMSKMGIGAEPPEQPKPAAPAPSYPANDVQPPSAPANDVARSAASAAGSTEPPPAPPSAEPEPSAEPRDEEQPPSTKPERSPRRRRRRTNQESEK